MDKALRDELRKATQSIRSLLEKEFSEQLEGTFDILADGTVLTVPGPHLSAAQLVVREKLVAVIAHKQASGLSPAAAVGAYLREAAFTTLNRFVALKMLEARGLVQECVSRGDESSGFKEFIALAPGLVQLMDKGYRLYIETVFDEIGQEVRVLFDRRDVASFLWPRRVTLLELLAHLNGNELKTVWAEDETIGWLYQYFNSGEERRQMRDESAAPRNSYELAVRNQFFTPRYVVEFLTDNTLGRIWYEMSGGATRLTQKCRYMVRRPHEIFLGPSELVPESALESDLSQEDLLLQTVYIQHRPMKDPREIRMLDPACGSMHFGLYAFDLFEVIYDEAWDLAFPACAENAELKPLRSLYASKEEYLVDVPRLIIEHNIHGIDIDPRAAQIAGLSLWLRAQRSWQQRMVPAQARARIQRSNVVCAEPMPGEAGFLDEFIGAQLSVTPEQKLLSQLVRRVFQAMKLAGEAGSLLKIEEEVLAAVNEAKEKWLHRPQMEQVSLFEDTFSRPIQQQLELDVAGIADVQFWEQAENYIYAALQAYAHKAEESGGFQRRLFAGDAARGFAFIDICRKRFDAVVMNPPFGAGTHALQEHLKAADSATWTELFTAMVSRGIGLAPSGLIGAITSRTCMTLSRLTDWRMRDLVTSVELIADLGLGVMDNAFVEACAYVCRPFSTIPFLLAQDLQQSSIPDSELLAAHWSQLDKTQLIERSSIMRLPEQRILLGVPPAILQLLHSSHCFEPSIGTVRRGFVLFDGFRFVRLFWEIPPTEIGTSKTWSWYSKGGEYQRHYGSVHMVALRAEEGAEMCALNQSKNGQTAQAMQGSRYYFRPGTTYTSRSQRGFAPRCLPAGCITSDSPAVLSESSTSDLLILGWLNSRVVRLLIELQASAHKYEPGHVKALPWPPSISNDEVHEVESITRQNILLARTLSLWDETEPIFLPDFNQRSIGEMITSWQSILSRSAEQLVRNQNRISEIFDSIYDCNSGPAFASLGDIEGDDVVATTPRANADFASGLVSWLVGCALGRWDIQILNGEKTPQELPDPFSSLPVCPLGQLRNDQGFPISQENVASLKHRGLWNYPIEIPWDGILVDDPGHPLDIETRVKHVLGLIWKDQRENIEHEACDILSVATLRDYFNKPAGFFSDHIKRYSKSRRKAPIYWPLATRTGSYTVWLYYHRLNRDTLFQVLDTVKNKHAHEVTKLRNLQQEAGHTPGGNQRKLIETQEAFIEELSALRDEVERAAPLWKPDLNDGVIINYALLWRLVSHSASWQKECKTVWDQLISGEYDWAHMSMHLWPERVIPKCKTDLSLAIAHGLSDVFWQVDEHGKHKSIHVDAATLEAFIAERTSPTVKAALQSLLDAPTPRGTSRPSANKRSFRTPRAPGSKLETVLSTASQAVLAEVDEDVLKKVRQTIAAVSTGAVKADVLTATGLNDSDWIKAISTLLARGEVTRSGEKRGTRYHASAREKTVNE